MWFIFAKVRIKHPAVSFDQHLNIEIDLFCAEEVGKYEKSMSALASPFILKLEESQAGSRALAVAAACRQLKEEIPVCLCDAAG